MNKETLIKILGESSLPLNSEIIFVYGGKEVILNTIDLNRKSINLFSKSGTSIKGGEDTIQIYLD